MGHVDHAHHAIGDGETQRCEQQDRALRDREHRPDRARHRQAPFDRPDRVGDRRPHSASADAGIESRPSSASQRWVTESASAIAAESRLAALA